MNHTKVLQTIDGDWGPWYLHAMRSVERDTVATAMPYVRQALEQLVDSPRLTSAQRVVVDDAFELVERNERRLSGALADGYLGEPDFAELGRLESMLRIARIPMDRLPGGMLDW